MRLSRTDLGAVLTILAGGAVGFSSSFLLLSRSDDESGPIPVVAPSATAELAVRVEYPSRMVVTLPRIKIGEMVITPVIASSTAELAVRVEHPDRMMVTSASIELYGMVITPVVASSIAEAIRLEEQGAALLRIEELQEFVRFQKSVAYARQVRDRQR